MLQAGGQPRYGVAVSSATLEFEEPITVLLTEIETLTLMPRTPARHQEIDALRDRVAQLRQEIFSHLTPWQRVLVARHPKRPYTLDYIARLFTEFTEIHGDRRFGDDHAIVAGFARFDGEPILVVGHQKGRDTKQKVYRNFGYARPEGYRKALRAMKLAEKFDRPIIAFIDTPAAYPGVESEERGVAEAIAYNLREMAMLSVPVVVAVTGEGGSGGALGLAVGDRILMQEYAIYGVIPPEGCAAILWRDTARKVEAADALKVTASDLVGLGVIDEVVPEPAGGAHTDPAEAVRLLAPALSRAVQTLRAAPPDLRLQKRHDRFRRLGLVGIDGV
jgi:acetyl-CoA carboxylase carboxyl transferase subunit alpha